MIKNIFQIFKSNNKPSNNDVKTSVNDNTILNTDDLNFKNSSIKECYLNDLPLKNEKINGLLKKIINKSNKEILTKGKHKLNIIDGRREDKGFKSNYIETLDISFQGICKDKAIKIIIRLCETQNINLNITLELEDKKIINIIIKNGKCSIVKI